MNDTQVKDGLLGNAMPAPITKPPEPPKPPEAQEPKEDKPEQPATKPL